VPVSKTDTCRTLDTPSIRSVGATESKTGVLIGGKYFEM
jgi:hypothetical protein